jgi:large subunit GTPase 1
LTFNTTHLFNRGELLALLKSYSARNISEKGERLMVGMIGYPNVGKSSVINVLCGKKLVGVANRPGKTKHFQTLNLSDDICLCDCPGLVFPSFANSSAEMMTCGVLLIDTIKNFIPPI